MLLFLWLVPSALSVTAAASGSVLAWGFNSYGQTNLIIPALDGVVAVAAGGEFTVILKNDGSVFAWGRNDVGQTAVPLAAQSGVTAIAAGTLHALALKADGSVVAWGWNDYGQTNVPVTGQSGVKALAAGDTYSLALKEDGSVVAWGNPNSPLVANVPVAARTGVVAIAAGYAHALALRDDGSVVHWGFDHSDVPAAAQSGVKAISAGYRHSLALKVDGSVVAWGYNLSGQTTVPVGAQSDVVAIAAGWDHSVVLKTDGSVLDWGSNFWGQTNVPVMAKRGVIAIAASLHTVAIQVAPIVITTFDPQSMLVTNTIPPGIFRYSGNPPDLRTNHQLLVRLTAPPSQKLRVYVQAVDRSGGHLHDDTPRPHGYLLTQDEDYPPLNTTTVAGGTFEFSTYEKPLVIKSGPSGTAVLYYVAPEISGEERIIVSTEAASPANRQVATNLVRVTVPALQPLLPSSTITTVGICDAHPRSHFGTADMIQAVTALAANYFAETGRRLPVNDMSLPQGGLFDIGPEVVCDSVDKEYGPFWGYGTAGGHKNHFGHRVGTEVDIAIGSKPSNVQFERILLEQGWWQVNPVLWRSEGNHYHLNLLGNGGRVTIDSPPGISAEVMSRDLDAGTVTFAIPNDNRGGLRADTVSVTHIEALNNVLLLNSGSVSLGPLQIRQMTNLVLQAILPPNVEQFFIQYGGVATSPDKPGMFGFPISSLYITKPVRVPSSSQPVKNRPRPAGPTGSAQWSLRLTAADQPASIGAPLVYRAVIDNQSGDKLFLNGLSLLLGSTAPKESYALDWSPEFLGTGGVIAASGYSGPLFSLRWLSNPPVGTVNAGMVTLNGDSSVDPMTLTAAFSSPFMLQSLSAHSTAEGVEISWNVAAVNYILQASDDPEGEEWATVNAPVVHRGGTNSVTVVPADVGLFYRLSSP